MLLAAFTLSLPAMTPSLRADESTAVHYRFAFGTAKAEPGYTVVPTDATYSESKGFGFDLGTRPADNEPFYFSVAVPEGNYKVTVTLGDSSGTSNNTIKAESRRLMLENVSTPSGKTQKYTFAVNVRTPRIQSGGAVKIKDREKGVLHWDEKLTLEFNGKRPRVQAVEIEKADDLVTVYLAGDSTVTDQPKEPWNSWGQMLTRFLKPDVVVANHAESGESYASSFNARRFDKIMTEIKKGDYLFLQFAHNDEKAKGPNDGAFKSFKKNIEKAVGMAKEKGAHVVLVTPMHRRSFDNNGKVADTHGDFPVAVRQVAKEQGLPMIDLHAMSAQFYEAMGPKDSAKAFQDGTHHNNYGSYELAKCVVEGIKQNDLGLAKSIVDDFTSFDPSKPDPVAAFDIPASPQSSATKPDGN